MLTKVEIRNDADDLMSLELENVIDGFVIKDIKGLGPVKATLVSSSFATMDGAQFQSSSREARNIVFQIGLEPDYVTTSVWDLRSQLYDFFMPKEPVNMRFFAHGMEVDISGIVETCDPSMFTNDPAMDISVMCFEPDFVPEDSVTVSEDTVSDTTEFLVAYSGSVETGMVFVLNVDRTLSEFTIYHRLPNGVIKTMNFEASLLADDVVTINTIAGSRGITLTRSSTDSSLLYALSVESPWHEFKKGDNYLRFYATGDPIPFTVTYTPRYGGL